MSTNSLQAVAGAIARQKMIDASTIRTVARLYARAERAILFWGMGVSQHTHGTRRVLA